MRDAQEQRLIVMSHLTLPRVSVSIQQLFLFGRTYYCNHLKTLLTHTQLFFDNIGWSIQLGGETKLSGVSINNGVPIPATIAYTLGGNFFIVAGIEEPYLKMIKIFVTGETSFDWIEAKYSTPASDSNCRSQSSFTEACYQGTSKSQSAYNVQLVATKESGY